MPKNPVSWIARAPSSTSAAYTASICACCGTEIRLTSAPSFSNVDTAASTPSATPGSMGSEKPSSRMPIRSPLTPPSRSDSASMLSGMPRRWRGSLSSYPATACSAAATSGTVRAIGPT